VHPGGGHPAPECGQLGPRPTHHHSGLIQGPRQAAGQGTRLLIPPRVPDRRGRATRPGEVNTPPYIKDLVQWGAGPRASINLILAGKARAVLNGRVHVTTDDIIKMAHPILRHRILPTFSAEAAGMSSNRIIDKLLADVPKSKG
jgi:hypothetical protein